MSDDNHPSDWEIEYIPANDERLPITDGVDGDNNEPFRAPGIRVKSKLTGAECFAQFGGADFVDFVAAIVGDMPPSLRKAMGAALLVDSDVLERAMQDVESAMGFTFETPPSEETMNAILEEIDGVQSAEDVRAIIEKHGGTYADISDEDMTAIDAEVKRVHPGKNRDKNGGMKPMVF